jgi:hypothetical protein
LRHEIRCIGGRFVDNYGHRRSTQRLSMAAWVQCGTAGGLIRPLAGRAAEVFAARRGQRSPTILSDSVAVIALWTPMRLRLSDFAAALMPGRHAVDCPERRVHAGFGGLRATTQHVDRRWWGRTR